MPVILYGNNNISGNSVRFNLNATEMQFGHANLWDIEPKPGQSLGSPWNNRLPQARYMGHEAPVIMVRGFIAVDQPDPTYISTRPIINEKWLGSLALVGSGWLMYRPAEQFVGSPWNNAGSIPAIIKDVTMIANTQFIAAGSEYINYTANFVLVSGPL